MQNKKKNTKDLLYALIIFTSPSFLSSLSPLVLRSLIYFVNSAIATLKEAADVCGHCQKNEKILLAGNGGSAADAQHIAGEFFSRFAFDRPGMAATIALTTDTPCRTGVGNDYDYEQIFSRKIQATERKDDLFIGYSTYDQSLNVLKAFAEAHSRGLVCIGLTHKPGSFDA